MSPANHVTRREFVKSSALLGAAAATSVFPSGAWAAGSDRLRVGVIGCGGRGTGAAADILAASTSTQLVALGELADALRKVIVRRLAVSCQCLTDQGQEAAKIKAENRLERPCFRGGELQHRHPAAALADASHFTQARRRVGQIPQSKGHRDDLECFVGEG